MAIATGVQWMSRDERRIPLMVRVSGPFGAIELELTTYRVG